MNQKTPTSQPHDTAPGLPPLFWPVCVALILCAGLGCVARACLNQPALPKSPWVINWINIVPADAVPQPPQKP